MKTKVSFLLFFLFENAKTFLVGGADDAKRRKKGNGLTSDSCVERAKPLFTYSQAQGAGGLFFWFMAALHVVYNSTHLKITEY